MNSLEEGEREREAMSLKKIMKSRGPRIEPCGTPDETGRELERLVPIYAYTLGSARQIRVKPRAKVWR